MENIFKSLKVEYTSGNLKKYSGRKTNLKNEYWYQKIQIDNLNNKNQKKTDIGIIGYACDEGVLRNQGRIGAKNGPEEIRKQLGKIPIHFEKIITDFGNVICVKNNLEDCQIALTKSISKLIKNKTLPIAIGGGHDIAYANFNGIKDALETSSKKRIGIINFDAHFDLRPTENHPTSGTPFYQILSENNNVDYFVIGIQQQSNTKQLFDIAKENNVSFITNFDCKTNSNHLKLKLNEFIKKVDSIYLTIDLDGFSSAYAPGVSAPSALGFSPHFVFNIIQVILDTKKVISVDIAELNPKYDLDNSTAKLAAKLVDFIALNS